VVLAATVALDWTSPLSWGSQQEQPTRVVAGSVKDCQQTALTVLALVQQTLVAVAVVAVTLVTLESCMSGAHRDR
jgi:hypothetical protein